MVQKSTLTCLLCSNVAERPEVLTLASTHLRCSEVIPKCRKSTARTLFTTLAGSCEADPRPVPLKGYLDETSNFSAVPGKRDGKPDHCTEACGAAGCPSNR